MEFKEIMKLVAWGVVGTIAAAAIERSMIKASLPKQQSAAQYKRIDVKTFVNGAQLPSVDHLQCSAEMRNFLGTVERYQHAYGQLTEQVKANLGNGHYPIAVGDIFTAKANCSPTRDAKMFLHLAESHYKLVFDANLCKGSQPMSATDVSGLIAEYRLGLVSRQLARLSYEPKDKLGFLQEAKTSFEQASLCHYTMITGGIRGLSDLIGTVSAEMKSLQDKSGRQNYRERYGAIDRERYGRSYIAAGR